MFLLNFLLSKKKKNSSSTNLVSSARPNNIVAIAVSAQLSRSSYRHAYRQRACRRADTARPPETITSACLYKKNVSRLCLFIVVLLYNFFIFFFFFFNPPIPSTLYYFSRTYARYASPDVYILASCPRCRRRRVDGRWRVTADSKSR